MLPRVFPEGTSREGGTRLREAPGLDAALHRARHMAPQASSTRDSTQRDPWWGGATIFELIAKWLKLVSFKSDYALSIVTNSTVSLKRLLNSFFFTTVSNNAAFSMPVDIVFKSTLKH
jgi:hypothetical protein